MPVRNSIKEYGAEQYYHAYNRGVGKMDIFRDEQDYVFMLHLLKVYLSPETSFDKYGRELPNYSAQVELVAYCLMPNHYHFLVYLKEDTGLEKLMRSVMTTYSRYFNQKYKRSGALFQGHFLASRITNEGYFWHISRYIHLNPMDIPAPYLDYPYSSVAYYLGHKQAKWLHPERIVEGVHEREQYKTFLSDYEEAHKVLANIKHELANKVEL